MFDAWLGLFVGDDMFDDVDHSTTKLVGCAPDAEGVHATSSWNWVVAEIESRDGACGVSATVVDVVVVTGAPFAPSYCPCPPGYTIESCRMWCAPILSDHVTITVVCLYAWLYVFEASFASTHTM